MDLAGARRDPSGELGLEVAALGGGGGTYRRTARISVAQATDAGAPHRESGEPTACAGQSLRPVVAAADWRWLAEPLGEQACALGVVGRWRPANCVFFLLWHWHDLQSAARASQSRAHAAGAHRACLNKQWHPVAHVSRQGLKRRGVLLLDGGLAAAVVHHAGHPLFALLPVQAAASSSFVRCYFH